MKKLSLLFCLSVLLFSCDSDDSDDAQCPSDNGEQVVYIANEGNFTQGNAQIGSWALESNAYSGEAYLDVNGEPLGDVLQSFYDMGDQIFWVINNSGKVVVTDRKLEKIGEITGLSSPRYFMPVSSEFAYITDLYSGTVAVVNLNSLSVDHEITVPVEGTDKLFLNDGTCYVLGSTLVDPDNWIYETSIVKIDVETETVTAITSPVVINDVAYDAASTIWLAVNSSDEAGIYTYDMNSDSFNYEISDLEMSGSTALSYNTDDDLLHAVISGDVYEIDAMSSTAVMIADLDLTYTYGVVQDEFSKDIYVCDAEAFGETGRVYRLNSEGEVLNQVVSGPLPRTVFVP